MSELINRRDFLKLAGLLGINATFPQFKLFSPKSNSISEGPSSDNPNFLIIVFDAWSAYHLSINGYPRETMPNLAELGKKAVIFHNHYSPGNFTTPGTASLLTGALPWSHQAISFNDVLRDEYLHQNIFSAFGDYHRIAYSHNFLVNTLLTQLSGEIDDYIPREELFLERDRLIELLFSTDEDIATVSWARALKKGGDHFSYSLFLSEIYEKLKSLRFNEIRANFPLGIPSINVDNYYLLENGIDYLQNLFMDATSPFLGYFHFLPPHEPYNTRNEFVGRFAEDQYSPAKKPPHLFSQDQKSSNQKKWRTLYDEFILYADAEFARLYHYLDQSGFLEKTWLILTSDHGELFERGIIGHLTPVLYEPVIRIPLLIFEPGRTESLHIYENTSGIDILPTLLKVTGRDIPAWVEGEVLPPYNGGNEMDNERLIFSLQARGTDKNDPITKATVALVEGDYKLIYYFGYDELGDGNEMIELFNIKVDPKELNDLSSNQFEIAQSLLVKIKTKLGDVNRSYS